MIPGVSTGGGSISAPSSASAKSGTGNISAGGLTFGAKDTMGEAVKYAALALIVVVAVRALK